MSKMMMAAPNQQRIVPAFVVERLEGKVDRTIIGFDKEGRKVPKVVSVDAGYLVKFPTKGHSIRVKDAADLKRLGFDRTIPLVDDNAENDDVVGYVPNSAVA